MIPLAPAAVSVLLCPALGLPDPCGRVLPQGHLEPRRMLGKSEGWLFRDVENLRL